MHLLHPLHKHSRAGSQPVPDLLACSSAFLTACSSATLAAALTASPPPCNFHLCPHWGRRRTAICAVKKSNLTAQKAVQPFLCVCPDAGRGSKAACASVCLRSGCLVAGPSNRTCPTSRAIRPSCCSYLQPFRRCPGRHPCCRCARSTGGPGQRGPGPGLGPVLMKAVMPYGLLTCSRPRSCVLSRWDHLNGSLTCQGQDRVYEWGCESWNSSSTGRQLQHLGRPNSHPGSDSSPLSFVLQPSEFWPAVL